MNRMNSSPAVQARINAMTVEELRSFVREVVATLYHDGLDTQWSPDTIQDIGDIAQNRVLIPADLEGEEEFEDEEEENTIEFLVVIDKRDAETEADRAGEVATTIDASISSMDEMGEGIDVLFHLPSVEEARAAEKKLEEADLPFVQSWTFTAPKEA